MMPSRFRAAGVADEDWAVLTSTHPNVLLIGPDPVTSEFAAALTIYFRTPVTSWQVEVDQPPTTRPCGTLVLHGADRLSRQNQRQLDAWLSETAPLQIVTIAATPLFPMVEQGSFLASLYYRLNVLYLTFDQA